MVKLLMDEKFLRAAAALIKAAKKEVYVVSYLMKIPNEKKPGKHAILYKELLEAMKRGLDCKVILNNTTPRNSLMNHNIMAGKWLVNQGIEVNSLLRNRTVHAKMIIVDGVTLILGSHNWTQRAVERNVEASALVKDMGVVKFARELFLELWEKSTGIAAGGNNGD